MAWLSGWRSRIPITIDPATISGGLSEDLTNFPVSLKLSSSSGLNNKDLTSIFGETLFTAGLDWQDFEMVVGTGAQGVYDTGGVLGPAVIRDGSTYKMWYGGTNGNWRILYCDSPDGITWSNHQLVIDINSLNPYDTDHTLYMSVIKEGSTYKMWRSGSDGTNYRIIYCDSANGINWSNHQMVVNINSEGADSVRAAEPWVIKDGDTYKMWYAGYDGTNWRIIYCDSTDGTNWSNFQMAIPLSAETGGSGLSYDTNHAFNPCAVKDGYVYKMWYGGHNGSYYTIVYCTSTDGINWSDHQMVIDRRVEGLYDYTHSYNPSVIKDDTSCEIWYSGYKSGLLYNTIHAISPNQERIAVTTSNGTTQCPVEIERWDNVNSEALLWVKVPTIASGTETQLYLYSNRVQAEDNDSYVGETTSTPAQSVWDSNFKGVWHMAQNPGVGPNHTLDSTSNESHGVPTAPITNTTYLNYDMSDLTDWGDYDTNTGVSSQVTFDSKSCMKLDTGASTASDAERIHWSAYGDTADLVFNFSTYFSVIGTYASADYLYFLAETNTKYFGVLFCSDGLYIYGTGGYMEVGTNLVQTGAWQDWLFDANVSTGLVDVYLDGALIDSVSCYWEGGAVPNRTRFKLYSTTNTNIVCYIDYCKVGSATTNTPMTTADLVTGKIGKAIDFDGTDDYINCGNSSSLDAIDAFTIEANFKLDNTFSSASSVDLGIFSKYSASPTHGDWLARLESDDGKFRFGYHDADAWQPLSSSKNTWSANDWFYVVATTYSGTTSSGTTLYINGVEDISDGINRAYTVNDNMLLLAIKRGLVGPFDGIIDEVRISNVARSEDWIKTTYYSNEDNLLVFDDIEYNVSADQRTSVLYTDADSFVVRGEIPDSYHSAYVTVYNGTSDGGTTPSNWDGSEALGLKYSGEPFDTTISGLIPFRTYYYKWYCTYSGSEPSEEWSPSYSFWAYQGRILKGSSNNFTAVFSEVDSAFYNTRFATVSYGTGAGLNVVEDDVVRLFWESTVSGTGNTIRQDASDLTTVR